MKKLLILSVAVLLLGGCTVDICRYESRGIVKPEPPEKIPLVAEVAFPWNPILNMLSNVIPTLGQTRRKAIEERIYYLEDRKFIPLHIETKDCE